MLVKDIMSRSVKTVNPKTSIQSVASLMCLNRFSALPVVEGEDRLVGILAERDILRYPFPSLDEIMGGGASLDFESMESDYKKVFPLKVMDLMTEKVVSVRPDIPILQAVSIMAKKGFRRIPVVDGEKLVGVISLGDIHRAIFIESFTEN